MADGGRAADQHCEGQGDGRARECFEVECFEEEGGSLMYMWLNEEGVVHYEIVKKGRGKGKGSGNAYDEGSFIDNEVSSIDKEGSDIDNEGSDNA